MCAVRHYIRFISLPGRTCVLSLAHITTPHQPLQASYMVRHAQGGLGLPSRPLPLQTGSCLS